MKNILHIKNYISLKGGMEMNNYKIEKTNGKFNLYSSKIGMYVMKGATIDEMKIALAREMEYSVKLEIVKLLMTFPHGFSNMDDEIIVYQEAVDVYNAWYSKIYQRIGFLEEYYSLIDEKIMGILA